MTDLKETETQLSTEFPIEPELPICDAHHHLWERPQSRYMPDDLLKDIGGQNIVKTVFVECSSGYRKDGPDEMKPLGETEFVLDISTPGKFGQDGKMKIAAGIIGFVNLNLGERVAPVIEAQLAIGGKRLCGIRYCTAWDPNPGIKPYMNSPKGLLLDPNFQKGFSYLKKYGLSFDAVPFFHQIPEVAALAHNFPDTTIIVNHIGLPIYIAPYNNRYQEVIQEWRRNIKELAMLPNIFMKLGGLGILPFNFGWNKRTDQPKSDELANVMAPYFNWCIDCFGTNRCMFESNFPEDKISYSYNSIWNAFKLITRDFSPGERAALFHDTAARIYRI